MNNVVNSSIEAEKMSKLERFLANTGSVIKLLQDSFGEEILVENLGQGISTSSYKLWKDISNDEKLLVRTVFLTGENSSKRYVYATSYIRIDLLPKEFTESLLSREVGIGELLDEYELDTERQIVKQRQVYSRLVRCIFPDEGQIHERQYTIYHQNQPVIFISEYYPGSV